MYTGQIQDWAESEHTNIVSPQHKRPEFNSLDVNINIMRSTYVRISSSVVRAGTRQNSFSFSEFTNSAQLTGLAGNTVIVTRGKAHSAQSNLHRGNAARVRGYSCHSQKKDKGFAGCKSGAPDHRWWRWRGPHVLSVAPDVALTILGKSHLRLVSILRRYSRIPLRTRLSSRVGWDAFVCRCQKFWRLWWSFARNVTRVQFLQFAAPRCWDDGSGDVIAMPLDKVLLCPS